MSYKSWWYCYLSWSVYLPKAYLRTGIYMFKVKVWNIFKLNNKVTRTTQIYLAIPKLSLEIQWVLFDSSVIN